MSPDDSAPTAVHIGVFAARNGWLLTHPDMQSRFERRDEAMAQARRLAHLECWRGKEVDVLVQDPLDARLAPADLRHVGLQEGWADL